MQSIQDEDNRYFVAATTLGPFGGSFFVSGGPKGALCQCGAPVWGGSVLGDAPEAIDFRFFDGLWVDPQDTYVKQ